MEKECRKMMEWIPVFTPMAISLALTFTLMPLFIGYFLMKKHEQSIREDGPKWHNQKAGTPTMGGLVFLVAIMLTSLAMVFFQKGSSVSIFLLLFIIALYGLLGFL